MLEAFQSLRKELTTKKQRGGSDLGRPLSLDPQLVLVNLDLPPPRPRTTSHTEEMDVDYGPALPPCLGSDLHNASEEPYKKVWDRPKNTLTVG